MQNYGLIYVSDFHKLLKTILQKSNGFPLPEWINTSFNGITAYDKLVLFMNRAFVVRNSEPILTRLRGGMIL